MIFCIPASEASGLDSAFEPDFDNAICMAIVGSQHESKIEVTFISLQECMPTAARFDAILCGRIERDTWSAYLHEGVRFFGVSASTVRDAIECYHQGNVKTVNVITPKPKKIVLGASGCGCGAHHHPAQAKHAVDIGVGLMAGEEHGKHNSGCG